MSNEFDEKMNLEDPAYKAELLLVPKFCVQCRICQLSRENVELYNWMCTLALQGYTPGRIYTHLVEHIEKNYPEMKPPSRKSVWRHLEKHVLPKESVEMIAARRTVSAVNVTDPLVDQKALDEIKAGNFDEYKELCNLYVKFREVNDKIYKLADSLAVDRGNNVSDWSQAKITTYVSMVNTQKSILAEIGKMRQSDKLVVMVAKYIVETFAKGMVHKLSDEFEALSHIMKRQKVDESVLQAFEAVAHHRLAKLIVDEADNAMTVTQKEFKLPTSN
jgi:predicted metalloenzyme YecM